MTVFDLHSVSSPGLSLVLECSCEYFWNDSGLLFANCECHGRCINWRLDVDSSSRINFLLMNFLISLFSVHFVEFVGCKSEMRPYSINKDPSDKIWIPDKSSQNLQVFSISHNADVTVLSCETLTPFILAAFLLITALPWEPAG